MSVYVNREVNIRLNVGDYQVEITGNSGSPKLRINREWTTIVERDLDADDVQALVTALQEIQALTD